MGAILTFACPGATSARRRQAAHAAAPRRSAPPGASASPMRRFVSMIFGERSRPAGRLVSPEIMEANGLSRAQGSRLAKRPRSGLALTSSTDQAAGMRRDAAPNNRPQQSRAQQSLSDLQNFGYSILVANSMFQRSAARRKEATGQGLRTTVNCQALARQVLEIAVHAVNQKLDNP